MSKGYVIVACGNDYVKQAYLCSLSIKATQAVNNVTLITDRPIDEKYSIHFDKVIVNNVTDNGRFKTRLRALVYDLSPYDETIVLDSDTIFTSDVSYYWDLLKDKDLFFPTKVCTYRGNTTDNRYYREVFKKFDLPNTYVAVHYFKKSELSNIFYSLVKFITGNEKRYYGDILETKKQINPSFDFTCALAIKMLDIEPLVTRQHSQYPTFTHLKGQNQNWQSGVVNWMNKVPYYIDNDLNVFIGNFKQTGILHYTENDFVTEEAIQKYEDVVCTM